jgi:hypothetical protein
MGFFLVLDSTLFVSDARYTQLFQGETMTRSKVLIGAVIVLSVITASVWAYTTVQPQADTFQAASPKPSVAPTSYALSDFTGKLEKSAAEYQDVAPYILRASYSTLVEAENSTLGAKLDEYVASGKEITIQGYENAEDGYIVIVAVTITEQ